MTSVINLLKRCMQISNTLSTFKYFDFDSQQKLSVISKKIQLQIKYHLRQITHLSKNYMGRPKRAFTKIKKEKKK